MSEKKSKKSRKTKKSELNEVNQENVTTVLPDKEIKNDIIKPTYIEDIQSTIKWRKYWRKIGNCNISFSKVLIIIASMLAFLESYFKTEIFSLTSGCVSLVGVLLQQYSEFAYKESTKRKLTLFSFIESEFTY